MKFFYLIELEHIQQLEELPVLLGVLELNVVLSQTVQGQLGLVVDVDFHGLKRVLSRTAHGEERVE